MSDDYYESGTRVLLPGGRGVTLTSELAEIANTVRADAKEELDMRPFPMMDGPPLPWFVADAIRKHFYGDEQSTERLAQRGGFDWSEIPIFWLNPRVTDAQRDAYRAAIMLAEGEPDEGESR